MHAEHVSLIGAWRNWLAGQHTAELVLGPLPLWWWARIGKSLELLGGLSFVIDIIGEQRLRRVGHVLQERYAPRTIVKAAVELVQLLPLLAVYAFWSLFELPLGVARETTDLTLELTRPALMAKRWKSYFFSDTATPRTDAVELRFKRYLATHRSSAVWRTLALLVVPVGLVYVSLSVWPVHVSVGAIWGFVVLLISVTFLLYMLSFPLALLLSLLALCVNTLVIQPLAYVAGREHFKSAWLVLAALLLVLGFHFDLLAS
jgi:hypothetical protein